MFAQASLSPHCLKAIFLYVLHILAWGSEAQAPREQFGRHSFLATCPTETVEPGFLCHAGTIRGQDTHSSPEALGLWIVSQQISLCFKPFPQSLHWGDCQKPFLQKVTHTQPAERRNHSSHQDIWSRRFPRHKDRLIQGGHYAADDVYPHTEGFCPK